MWLCNYKAMSASLKLNVSETKGVIGLFPIGRESNGHFTYDVTTVT